MKDENNDDTSIEYKRLKWACRRGMLELDVLLEPFLEQAYPSLSEKDQSTFKRLITCEDTELFAWFMQKDQPEDLELNRLVKMILDRVQPS